jgi:DNA-binding GntR family transcriptional regulator
MRQAVPPYKRIAAELRAKIEAGELRPGEQVPSANKLAEEHGVNRNTALRALKLLAGEGLITMEQGWGSFVSDPTAGS